MPGSLVPIPFLGLGPAGRQPGQGKHGQGDVGIPGPPGADLVVIQPGLVFRLLEALLDMPPAARDPGQVGGAGAAGPVAGVISDLLRIADRPAGQQPVPAAARPPGLGPDRDPGPVELPRAVRPGPGRDPLPALRGNRGDQIISPPFTSGAWSACRCTGSPTHRTRPGPPARPAATWPARKPHRR